MFNPNAEPATEANSPRADRASSDPAPDVLVPLNDLQLVTDAELESGLVEMSSFGEMMDGFENMFEIFLKIQSNPLAGVCCTHSINRYVANIPFASGRDERCYRINSYDSVSELLL